MKARTNTPNVATVSMRPQTKIPRQIQSLIGHFGKFARRNPVAHPSIAQMLRAVLLDASAPLDVLPPRICHATETRDNHEDDKAKRREPDRRQDEY